MIYGLLAFLIYKKIMGQKFNVDLQTKRIITIFSIYIFFGLLSLLYGTDGYDMPTGFQAVKTDLIDCFFMFLIYLYFVRKAEDAKNMLIAFSIILTIFCCMTIYESIFQSVHLFGFDTDGNRPNGPIGEPNQTAAILAGLLPLIASFAMQGKAKTKIFFSTAFVVVLGTLFLTGSRGGMIAAVITLFVYALMISGSLRMEKKLKIAMILPILLIAVWVVIPEYYKDLVASRFSFAESKSIDWKQASAGRTMIWEYGLKMWNEDPFFGQGWSAFTNIHKIATHNIYLDLSISLGIFGLSIFLLMIGCILAIFWRSYAKQKNRETKILFAGLFCLTLGIFAALSFVNLYKAWLIVWAMLATGVRLSIEINRLAKNKVVIERGKPNE
jgi:O-antigen ligase